MEVMDAETSRQRGQGSLMMMVGGAVLVMALVGVSVAIS
jgi:predicted nucleic acid-binding Zn ribbon protein